MHYFDDMSASRFRELTDQVARADPYDYLLAKLLAVIDEYVPDPPPPIGSWQEFETFWNRWYPDEMLALNRGRAGRPDPDQYPVDYSATVKVSFMARMCVFLDELRENRLETLNLLSRHQWALTRPPKRGLLKRLFG